MKQTNDADIYCTQYKIVKGSYHFDISYYGEAINTFVLNIGGFYNIENAIAAIAVAKKLNISDEKIRESLASFKGIRRRFEKIIDTNEVVFIDDYAHHPQEIKVFLESVRELYPSKKVTAVFQPHLYSRTRDLADEFASALSIASEVLLLDIYPAREEPIDGVSSELIFNKLTCERQLIKKEELLQAIRKKDIQVLVTIGAGDIDKLINPIKALLSGSDR